MPTTKSRMEPAPGPQRLAAPRGTVEAAVDKVLLGVSRTTRGESFKGHARFSHVRAAKYTGAEPASAWHERTGA